MKKLLLAGAFLLTPTLAHSVTYYVAKTGSNNHTCNQAQSVFTPKLTISEALKCLSGGDTLIIKAGTYTEGVERNAIPSGTASARTIVRAATGEKVIINGVNSISDAFSIYDRSYITLDGLTIDGGRLRIGGGGVGRYSHYITVQNSVIRNTVNANYRKFSQSCVTTQGPAGRNSHINYINNEIYNCGSVSGHGLYLHARDSVIEGNRIHGAAKVGIHVYHSKEPREANNNIIRYNDIHDNGTYGILISSGSSNIVEDNTVQGNSGGGIMLAYGPSNTRVSKNKIYHNKGICIRIRRDAINSSVTNNTCLQNSQNRILDEGVNTIESDNLFPGSPLVSAPDRIE